MLMTTATPVLRWMIRRDLDTVMAIERCSFRHPWTRDEMIDALRDRSVIPVVADINGVVAAYNLYELHEDHLNIINLAVHPSHRRHGLARRMVERLKDKLSKERRTHITACVSEMNLAAQLFLRSQDFHATTIIGHVETGFDEDVYLMQYAMCGVPVRGPAARNRIAQYLTH